MSKSDYSNLQGFTLGMALMDMIPVAAFALSMISIALRFHSLLFWGGACLIVLAGAGKVLWKFLLALAHKNVMFFNRQMRIVMPIGFMIALISILIHVRSIPWSEIGSSIISFPAILFFAFGIIGIVCMSIFAAKLDGSKAKNNWIEQSVNSVAQICFMIGILCVCFL